MKRTPAPSLYAIPAISGKCSHSRGIALANFDERSFALMDRDDVDFWVIGKQRLGRTGRVVATRHHQLPGIGRFDPLCQT